MPPSPRSPRKGKPSFEIPADTGATEKPVEWVYRGEEPVAQTPPAVIPITSGSALERPLPVAAKPAAMPFTASGADLDSPDAPARPYHPALVAGAGLFYLGAGGVALVSVAALAIIGKPIRMAKGLLGIG